VNERRRKLSTRSYPLDISETNVKKLAQLDTLLPHWQQASVKLINYYRQLIFQGHYGKLPRIEAKPFIIANPTIVLGARQWQDCGTSAMSTINSWLSNRQNDFKKIVANSTFHTNEEINQDIKHQLYAINNAKAWYVKEPEKIPSTTIITFGALKLARQIFKTIRKKNRWPNLSRSKTINCTSLLTTFQEAKTATYFDGWIKLTGLAMPIPYNNCDYTQEKFDNATKVKDAIQCTKKTGEWIIRRVIEQPDEKPRKEGGVISWDWGTVHLLALNDGRLFGTSFCAWLREMDAILIALQKELQKRGINPSKSKRYKKLQSRIREYARNEIGRLLNKLAGEYIQEIAVEDLDFRGGGLSRTMNRILTRAGRKAIELKLKDLEEHRGVKVTEVNSRYTSQECSRCHFVSKKNRTSRGVFKCQACHLALHADVNAARVILERRSIPGGLFNVSKSDILKLLEKKHAAARLANPQWFEREPSIVEECRL